MRDLRGQGWGRSGYATASARSPAGEAVGSVGGEYDNLVSVKADKIRAVFQSHAPYLYKKIGSGWCFRKNVSQFCVDPTWASLDCPVSRSRLLRLQLHPSASQPMPLECSSKPPPPPSPHHIGYIHPAKPRQLLPHLAPRFPTFAPVSQASP